MLQEQMTARASENFLCRSFSYSRCLVIVVQGGSAPSPQLVRPTMQPVSGPLPETEAAGKEHAGSRCWLLQLLPRLGPHRCHCHCVTQGKSQCRRAGKKENQRAWTRTEDTPATRTQPCNPQ